MNRSVEEFLPHEILAFARNPGIAFVPVSPLFEWHSWHLPVGVDGMIAEAVASRLAGRLGAAWFRVLPLGLDEVRSEGFKKSQGLDPATSVFGMNYPALPLQSEYAEAEELRRLLSARLCIARAAGFRHVFIINHHGGCGQMETLSEAAALYQTEAFRVEVLRTVEFDRYQPPAGREKILRTGGHAGIAETIQFCAFYPDAVDLSQLPEGPLCAAENGILHSGPEISEEFNPRRTDLSIARDWGAALLDTMERHVRESIKAGGHTA